MTGTTNETTGRAYKFGDSGGLVACIENHGGLEL